MTQAMILWAGNDRAPVSLNTPVTLLRRDGMVIDGEAAGCFCWKHYGVGSDIIGYFVHGAIDSPTTKPAIEGICQSDERGIREFTAPPAKAPQQEKASRVSTLNRGWRWL